MPKKSRKRKKGKKIKKRKPAKIKKKVSRKIKKRRSSFESLTEDQQNKFKHIYSDLDEKINNSPSVIII